jgi:AcrR family transcriptional regulator
MPRRKSISDEHILTVAGEVFLQHGVGASTLEIARRAGISEALLFKRFGSKEALFRSSLNSSGGPPWARRLEELQGRGDMRANLTEIAGEILAFYRELVPRIFMAWSARRDSPHPPDGPPVRALKALTNFLDAEMRAGRLRTRDPEVVARTLLGALFSHISLELVGLHELMPMPDATFVRGLVETLWTGLAPAGSVEGK